MKKVISTIIIAIYTLSLMATDVNVDATGAIAGSYTTIQAAINVSNNGDRIVVFASGHIYKEDTININKSLTLLAATPGEYFFIKGNVQIVPANGREITIVGLHLNGDLSSTDDNTVGARCTVNIVDGELFGNIDFSNNGFDVNVLYNRVLRTVGIRHGKIIGNEIGLEDLNESSIYGKIEITEEDASYGTGDTILIIANKISKNFNNTYRLISFDNQYARYFIANNAIRNGTVSSGTAYKVGVEVLSCDSANRPNVFMNNFVSVYVNTGSCNSSSTEAAIELLGIVDENLINNIIYNRYGANYGCGFLGQRGDYNIYKDTRTYPSGYDNNIEVDALNIDLGIGRITSGTGIDQGKQGAPYMDINLTRNDIGTYGGPYSWDNYWDTTGTAKGRARIYSLDIPSNIYSISGPTTIKASSTHLK